MRLPAGRVWTTKAVAQMLGIRTNNLQMAVYNRRLAEPPRGPDGRSFLWTIKDIARASQVFRHKGTEDLDLNGDQTASANSGKKATSAAASCI
jgi:hypothetical protein